MAGAYGIRIFDAKITKIAENEALVNPPDFLTAKVAKGREEGSEGAGLLLFRLCILREVFALLALKIGTCARKPSQAPRGRFRKAASSAAEGRAGQAPGRVQARAPAAEAWRSISDNGRPSARPRA